MEVEVYAATDSGRVRYRNEDNYLLLQLSTSKFWTKTKGLNSLDKKPQIFEHDEDGVILAVSDGCGGAVSGEVSSELVVENIKKFLTDEVSNDNKKSELVENLYDAALFANRMIHHEIRENSEYGGMGATLTAAAITLESVDFIQIGDSRGYLIRNSKIYRITKDQSLVNQLIDKGEISPEEAETHALKNVILQAMGAQNEIYPVCNRLIPQKDDILLLCSDGLSNKLKDQDLLRIVLANSDELENACKTLVTEANLRGGEDNITVILARLAGNDLLETTDDSVLVYPIQFPENSLEN
jgi:protein phosphatase